MFRDVKAVNGGDLIPKSPGQPGNIGSCGFAVIDFISQVLHLCFGNAVLKHSVEIVICAVVMAGIGTKIAVLIYIPFGIVSVGVQAISDVAGGDVLVAHHSAVPSADVTDNNDRLGKLNIQVDSLIGEVVVSAAANAFRVTIPSEGIQSIST